MAWLDTGWAEQRDHLSYWFSDAAVGVYPGKYFLPSALCSEHSQVARCGSSEYAIASR
jgi:hypothetical protein